MPEKVLVAGTFDCLHPGHLNFFWQARQRGSELVVVIARDVNVEKTKGHAPRQSETERHAAVAAVPLVSRAVLGSADDDYLRVVRDEQPDTICLGYDQESTPEQLTADLAKHGLTVRVERLTPFYPERFKSALRTATPVPRELLVGSNNAGKVHEITELLATLNPLVSTPRELGVTDAPDENGTTLEENAFLKAQFYAERTGLLTLADDTGLEIDALGGEPGPRVRRWPGHEATDQELIDFTLTKLADVPPEQRGAQFRSVVCCYDPATGTHHFTSGVVRGILAERVGASYHPGLPFDALFSLPEIGKFLGEVKGGGQVIDHRALAIRAMVPYLTRHWQH